MTNVTAAMVLAACDAYRKSARRKPVNGSFVEDMRCALEAALSTPPSENGADDGAPTRHSSLPPAEPLDHLSGEGSRESGT